MKFIAPKENAISVTEQLVKLLNVKITANSIQKKLEAHPDYPSLLAISDSLNEWGITSQSYQINKEEFDREDLYYPFIAHLRESGGRFVLIRSIEGDKVLYSDELTKNGAFTIIEFLKRWSGFALYATADEKSGEIDYRQNRFKELLKWLLAPTAILTLVIALYLNIVDRQPDFAILTLSFLKLSGIGVSILLLIQSLNSRNPFINNLCNLTGKNDCNALLKSDVAKVTSWLNWSEVGFFYFAGTCLSLLFVPVSINLLAWLSFFTLPYAVYSISYQYRYKNWCLLCCIVQSLLVLEAVTFFTDPTIQILNINYLNFSLSLLICFLFPILIWSFLKPFFADAGQVKSLKRQLQKFKYNSDLFNQVLTSRTKYAIPDNLMPIVLGNPNAETTITIVSNPFCSPCGKAHETLNEWLKVNDDIKVKVIFTSANQENDERTKVSRHINALSRLNDVKLVEKALNDWYLQGTKKYETWAQSYPISLDEDLSEVTEKQKAWCELAEITFTPTILVNGYKLPEPYKLEDIKYILS